MTDQERQRLWQLILRYEDLDAGQRLEVDQALAADADLQRDWARLCDLEQRAQLKWAAEDEAFWQPELDRKTAADCQASLSEVLARLPAAANTGERPDTRPFEQNRSAKGPARSWQLVPPLRVLWPLAAVLALVVLYPRLTSHQDLLGHLAVRTVDVAPDGTRSGQPPVPIAGQLRSGQAFVLSLDLAEASWLVVYHVDPRGKCVRIFDDAAAPGASGMVTVPAAGSGDFWVLDGEPGLESFVVGATSLTGLDQGALTIDLADGCAGSGNRTTKVAAVSAALGRQMSEVQVLTFEHLPLE